MVTILDVLMHKAQKHYLSDNDIYTCVNSIQKCDYELTYGINPDADWLGVRNLLAIRLVKLLQRLEKKIS